MALYSDDAVLIGFTVKTNEYKQQIKVPTRTEIYVNEQSIGANEFFAAGEQGFKAEISLATALVDYDGQDSIEYHGKVYDIYRTAKRGDRVFLYLRSKVGVK